MAMVRELREIPTKDGEGELLDLPRLPIDWERMTQLLVSLVMVAAAGYLLLRGMDRGGSSVWGATIVSALLVLGSIGLAIDRRS